jgi:hypothetical protein
MSALIRALTDRAVKRPRIHGCGILSERAEIGLFVLYKVAARDVMINTYR